MPIAFTGESNTIHAHLASLAVGKSIRVYLNEIECDVLRMPYGIVTMKQIDFSVFSLRQLVQDVAQEYGEFLQVVLLKEKVYLSIVSETLNMETLYRTMKRYASPQ